MKYMHISRQDIIELKRKGYNLIDMHVHTNASPCSLVDVQSILKKAKEMGIGVAITDHDKIDSAVVAFDNKLSVLIIPGIEIYAKRDRHVLFYFYEKKELVRFYNNEIKNKFLSKSVNELMDLKDKYKCIVGIAHPRGYRIWHAFRINYNIKKIDFLEVLNSDCLKRKMLKSYKWALRYKKGMTGGSDMHKLSDLGKCLMCSKGKTIKDVLDSIKKRKTFTVGSTLSFGRMLKKLPRDMYHLSLWVLERTSYYTGTKRFIKKKILGD